MKMIAALAVAGCGAAAAPVKVEAPVAVAPPRHAVSGRIAGAAWVTLTDPATHDVVGTVAAGADGRFAIDVPAAISKVALAAAGTDGFAYAASVPIGAPVDLALDRACERIAGRVDAGAPVAAGYLPWAHISNEDGDLFPVPLAADGTLAGCLPPGDYFVEPVAPLAARGMSVRVPLAQPLAIRTTTLEAADRPAPPLDGIAPLTTSELAASTPADAVAIGLGESNHGTREFYDERAKLALELARTQGFRLILLEAGFGEMISVDDYVQGKKIDIARAVQQLGYWVYDTKNFLAALEAVRAYNLRLPAARRIHVLGFDVQDTTAVVDLATAADPRLAPLLAPFAQTRGEAWKLLGADQRAAVRAALAPVAAARDRGGALSPKNRRALAAHALLARLDCLEGTTANDAGARRDRGMAEVALDLLQREHGARAMLWAHVGHLARAYRLGAPPMGAYLADALGARYQVFALLAARGSARAWDIPQKIGVIPQPLAEPPPSSLEHALAARAGGAPITYWRFASATGETAAWLGGLHRMRDFGSVHVEPARAFSIWDLRGLDGAVLFDEISPTDPTPTGERHAK